jgi:hypothetical protein
MKYSDLDDGENFLYWATGKSPNNEPVEDDLNIKKQKKEGDKNERKKS